MIPFSRLSLTARYAALAHAERVGDASLVALARDAVDQAADPIKHVQRTRLRASLERDLEHLERLAREAPTRERELAALDLIRWTREVLAEPD